ncbi:MULTISPECIES: branched-chain amino acid ABC transporter permease [Methylobacterium]|jgi:branched-chain amino acid transport system permease protein|uniref:Amino acid ABC transporter n=2 Tax=Methylobacterium TaxID=407 RepID=A0A0C6FQB8_9HYPH|nr:MULTISPECIES: branched-chain amino acid ABC transporter permease [Methylobacterium]MBZ6414856.1 branched-chain amino acid ABC transporter permease [Methylobacterium sp.]MBK3395331.1 branched-chain amino acid ABC transporter permease [Methylobacterium ajmalii]MBK3407228.1 branched-chain amino acid ABC transporter permease [Methylobacterium ajmalii]MBK3423757.1 branched-chain amino acid ABC transporter permease [Methylobacterium ajmalii]SFF25157.1 amino acid/amide ABC transporter membrane pro
MWEALDDFYWTYQSLIHAIGVNGILALSVYVVLAVGQLSLGQAAFMGVGAYTGALLSVKFGVPFGVAMLASAVVPALLALVVGGPTLRLTGVYLAIATIGLGEITRIVFLNWDYAGGALGLSSIPERGGVLAIYGTLVVLLVGLTLVARSRVGRAMEAMREDEAAAGVMGVNLPRYRLVALVVSSAMAGVAGCLSAHVSSFIGPNEYGFEAAVTILSYALLGGIGSPLAPVLGSTILTLLPEVLRPLADFRLMVNGLIIVLAVLFMPRGILPWRIARTG